MYLFALNNTYYLPSRHCVLYIYFVARDSINLEVRVRWVRVGDGEGEGVAVGEGEGALSMVACILVSGRPDSLCALV